MTWGLLKPKPKTFSMDIKSTKYWTLFFSDHYLPTAQIISPYFHPIVIFGIFTKFKRYFLLDLDTEDEHLHLKSVRPPRKVFQICIWITASVSAVSTLCNSISSPATFNDSENPVVSTLRNNKRRSKKRTVVGLKRL